ncbi:hypothetical protein I4U23_017096 [Adineta vaga]|nr:hypothetical protein I4U23_017096 [Adineta vaga]
MILQPRLYARTRARKTNRSLPCSFRPVVLLLLDADADSNLMIRHLSKDPILCQVIVLSDVNDLNQYYRMHDNNDDNDNYIYFVKSASFIERIDELANTNDNFFSISTDHYTLDFNQVPDEESGLFSDEECLAKFLRDYFNSFLTLADVDLSSQSVSLQTPRFAWFQFMFKLLSTLERSDIGMEEVIDRLHVAYHSQLDIIEEFIQTYSSEKAIEWCMKDSFYFSRINRTLRSRSIKDVFTHRTIFRDVEQSLISWHNNQETEWDFFYQ